MVFWTARSKDAPLEKNLALEKGERAFLANPSASASPQKSMKKSASASSLASNGSWLSSGSGTMAQRLAHPRAPGRHIVVCVNDSESAKKALEFAIENVLNSTTRDFDVIHLCHFYVMQSHPVAYAMEAIRTEEEYMRKQSVELLRKFGRVCKQYQVTWKAHLLTGRDVGDTIVSFTKKMEPHLLVVGSEGRNALMRVLLGSVASYCTNQCECPVTVVR